MYIYVHMYMYVALPFEVPGDPGPTFSILELKQLPIWTEITMLEQKEICVVSGFLKLNSLERGFQRAAAPGGPLSLFFLHRNTRIILN